MTDAVSWNVALDDFFDLDRDLDYNRGGSTEFDYIFEPCGQLQLEDLGRPNKDGDILETLHCTLKFASAQVAHVEQRFEFGAASTTTLVASTDRPPSAKAPITGTITDSTRQRSVQKKNITFNLIVFLSLVAAVHIWALGSDIPSWSLTRSSSSSKSKKLPSSRWLLDLEFQGTAAPVFNTVAMMTCLLDGSKCWKFLSENAHQMQAEKLYQHLHGKDYRLGWFYDAEKNANIYTIGALNDGNLIVIGQDGASLSVDRGLS